MSDSLRPHGLQRTRPLCPSPTPGAYSDSCPLSRWCHPAISSSVVPFSCLQSFLASGSFPTSQLFTSGGQSISNLLNLLNNIQDWFPLGWTGWITLQSKGLSRVFSIPQFKSISSLVLSFLYSPTLTSIHDHWKNIALTRWTFVSKVTSLLFNMLSRFVITCLPRSKLGYHWPFKEIVWVFPLLLLEVTRQGGLSLALFACSVVGKHAESLGHRQPPWGTRGGVSQPYL